MVARDSSSLNHSLLCASIGAALCFQVPADRSVFGSDLRIYVPRARMFTYPDCSVACGKLELYSDKKDVLLNPLLIAEVLSPSTEAYDRGKKFEMYRTIESFREYSLTHQDRRHVEHYSKLNDGSWLLREHSGTESAIAIPRLNLQISMQDLYSSALNLPLQETNRAIPARATMPSWLLKRH